MLWLRQSQVTVYRRVRLLLSPTSLHMAKLDSKHMRRAGPSYQVIGGLNYHIYAV